MTRAVGKLDDTTSPLLNRSPSLVATKATVTPTPSLADLRGVKVNVRDVASRVVQFTPTIVSVDHSKYLSIQYPLVFPPVSSGTGGTAPVEIIGYVFSDPNNSENLALL